MHSHSHNNQEHSAEEKNIGASFVIGIALNAIFVLIEFYYGFVNKSLALTADAWHNLGDVAGLAISWFAFAMAAKKPSQRFTYGFSKGTILASLASCLLLLFAVINIGFESIHSFSSPNHPQGQTIWIVAAIGIVVNLVTAFQFHNKNELNSKAAFMHLFADAMVSAAVLIVGLIIQYTGWVILDGLVSLGIAAVILYGTWNLFLQSLQLSLDGVPKGIDVSKIESEIVKIEGVVKVFHLHVWAISTTRTASTLHILIESNMNIEQIVMIKKQIKSQLNQHQIEHATIEVDIEETSNLEQDGERNSKH